MATLADELTALKTEEDKITGNKVANFSYDDYAYEHNDANGVDTYNVDNHQNIPNGTANILKVNATILTKGWRAQASAITRMLMNHFLGRCSYNLNKVNDHFSTLLAKLIAYIGVANGIATLGSDGYVPTGQLSPTGVVKTVNSHTPSNGNVDVSKSDVGLGSVVNTGDSTTPVSGGTTKFTTGGAYADKTSTPTAGSRLNFTAGGAYTELAKKAPVNHASNTAQYGLATTALFGHVRVRGNFSNITTAGGNPIALTAFGAVFVTNSTGQALQQSILNRISANSLVCIYVCSDGTQGIMNIPEGSSSMFLIPASGSAVIIVAPSIMDGAVIVSA